MQANIVIAGVPRDPETDENARRVGATLDALQRRYPGAVADAAKVEPLGPSSQTVSFIVKAEDLRSAQAMLAYFEDQLVKNGFAPTHRSRITPAGALSLLRRLTRWKFW